MAELEKAYCISCGEETRLEKVDLGIEGDELYRCAQCGAYLGTRKSLSVLSSASEPEPGLLKEPIVEAEPRAEFQAEDSSVSTGPIPEMPKDTEPGPQFLSRTIDDLLASEAETEPESPKLETIILAEDSELASRILKELIVKKGLGARVISTNNGFDFVISYIKSQREKVPPGLAIIDVIMPVLNGISAAVAIRSWEKALGVEPVPILFFTAKRCDETFKQVISYCRPAIYINKGTSESAVSLEQRIEKVINQLLKENF